MIKKLQALKAKKGFTLVELIVVIAIIGVLAAILVPTMLGYVTSSRVTSANSTAASIKNNIDTFLTSADTAGYGMSKSSTDYATLNILVSADGWQVNCTADAKFKESKTGVKWAATGTAKTKDDAKTGTVANDILAVELANLFPEVKKGSIAALLKGGKCVGVAYSTDIDSTMVAAKDYPDVENGEFKLTFAWNGKDNGITGDDSTSAGSIVGTAPAILIN